MKRTWHIACISLILLIAGAYLPVHAFANSNEESLFDQAAWRGLPDSDQLLIEYLQVQGAAQATTETPSAAKAATSAPTQTSGTKKKSSRGDRLSGNDWMIYQALQTELEKIAAGSRQSAEITIPVYDIIGGSKRTWTAADLGVDRVVVNGKTSDAAQAAFTAVYDFDSSAVQNALLADLPYDLYWFDKTRGCQVSRPNFRVSWGSGSDGVFSFVDANPVFTFRFHVAAAYSADGTAGTTACNVSKLAAAKTAAANAAAIVTAQASRSDYEKVCAYKQTICDLVSYDREAADDKATLYGDPWQLIYVFDGDSSTNVVCEGYAKAFQYLCDLTSFQSPLVHCVSVSGYMGTGNGQGNHMWNILTMDDGVNYLVDVTNCDGNSVGAEDLLFLMGYTDGTVQDGYTFAGKSGKSVYYSYRPETMQAYDEAELTLSAYAYTAAVVPAHTHNWSTPTYVWGAGGGTVTARRSCSASPTHIETETVRTTSTVTTSASGKEQITYTAFFANPAFAPQTKTVSQTAEESNAPTLGQALSIEVRSKAVSASKLKKKAQTAVTMTVKGAKGTVRFKVAGGSAKAKKALKLNKKTGKITIKKGTKRGTYRIKVKVTAAATGDYRAATATIPLTIVVY